jgi:hypothetical protein
VSDVGLINSDIIATGVCQLVSIIKEVLSNEAARVGNSRTRKLSYSVEGSPWVISAQIAHYGDGIACRDFSNCFNCASELLIVS